MIDKIEQNYDDSMRITFLPGCWIHQAIEELVRETNDNGLPVYATFNDTTLYAEPGETFDDVKSRYEEDTGLKVQTDEEIKEDLKSWAKDLESEQERVRNEMINKAYLTEEEMREQENPAPSSIEDLMEYVNSLVDRPHDYGTSTHAVALGAVATYNYLASVLGITGFQAGYADMEIIRRTRRMEDGFQLVDFSQVYYPQYWENYPSKVTLFIDYIAGDWDEVARKAQEKLEEGDGLMAEEVRDHLSHLSNKLWPPAFVNYKLKQMEESP